MRRSSMRRGSAVLLSILPLLAPTYALPTYMGNEATVAHMNVERAAVPEAAINLDFSEPDESAPVPANGASTAALGNIASEGSDNWLIPKRREKRQAPSSDTISGADSSSGESGQSPAAAAVRPRRKGFIDNIGSYGPSMWLGTAKRDIEEREAAPEADPVVTLDFNYKPPPINRLAPNPTA